jgi:hemerythrin-like domain-containing protein
MDAIGLLREDHERVLAMLDRLEAAPTVGDGTDERVLEARKKLVTDIVIAESQHETVEDQYFWPMVRREVPNGEELAGPALDQEAAAKNLLDALDKASAIQSDFDEMVTRLIREGREHIAYEQHKVWPVVQAVVSAECLNEIGDRMAQAKAKAPTRPHPDTPPGAGTQQTIGRVSSLADRIRDSISGRGRD